MKKLFSFTLLLILFFSITNAQEVSHAKDSAARQIKPIENKAIVFIIRPSIIGYKLNPYIDVFCDKAEVGSTDFSTYLYTVVDPGKHGFISKAENKATLELDTEAGKIYYVEQQVKMGFTDKSRTKLVLISEEQGKEFIKITTLSRYNAYSK